jgi:hypothetical protein
MLISMASNHVLTPLQNAESQVPSTSRSSTAAGLAVAFLLMPAAPALAQIHAEPSNALSLSTWAIHISSTVEWGTAMYLFWQYAEATGD